MLGTSDAWSNSHLSTRTSEPPYYIVDCWISLHTGRLIKRIHPCYFCEMVFQYYISHKIKELQNVIEILWPKCA